MSRIAALDDQDEELANDGAIALGRWGSTKAEEAMWHRLERFHQEWTGREQQLRITPDYRSENTRWASFERTLVQEIASGTNWLCTPAKLVQLQNLASDGPRRYLDGLIKTWSHEPSVIITWLPDGSAMFSLLQYSQLDEEQFRAKLSQFSRGTKLVWNFFPPERMAPSISLKRQQALYDEMRTVADEHGLVLDKFMQP